MKVILACWLVFFGYWVISLRGVKKTVERPSLAAWAANRIPLSLGGWLLFISGWAGRSRPWAPWNALLVPQTRVVEVVAAAICVLGVAGAIWARRTLAGNWSGEPVFKQNQELVDRGPYRLARHPIYTSMLLMALGTALSIGRIGAFVGLVLMGVGFIVRIKQEEALMTRHFPAQYAQYKSRVKALIPFLL